MADRQQLELLLQGVEAWNRWIRNLSTEERVSVDLSGANLSERRLVNSGLGKRLTTESTLGGMDLAKVDLEFVNLKGINLRRADLREGQCYGAKFIGADLYEANCNGAELGEADFDKAYLVGASFKGARLYRVQLEGANIIDADFSFADLSGARLRDMNFGLTKVIETDFSYSDLRGANFNNTDLTRCDFNDAKLSGATFRASVLRQADFGGADLTNADLSTAVFERTILGGTNLEGTKGLDTCVHYGPSILDHKTLMISGMLPLNFLRGCGLHDTLIEYLPSLISEPIQFYSCFISHSSKDKRFCERLYADLQNKGVRTWYFPEDAKWGKSVWHEIDSSIRLYDKLIVVCSRRSLQSRPVLREIERALDREDKEKKDVLFPVRLDKFVFDDWQHERKADVLSKVVGDFEGWYRNPAKYETAFNKLLTALKT